MSLFSPICHTLLLKRACIAEFAGSVPAVFHRPLNTLPSRKSVFFWAGMKWLLEESTTQQKERKLCQPSKTKKITTRVQRVTEDAKELTDRFQVCVYIYLYICVSGLAPAQSTVVKQLLAGTSRSHSSHTSYHWDKRQPLVGSEKQHWNHWASDGQRASLPFPLHPLFCSLGFFTTRDEWKPSLLMDLQWTPSGMHDTFYMQLSVSILDTLYSHPGITP